MTILQLVENIMDTNLVAFVIFLVSYFGLKYCKEWAKKGPKLSGIPIPEQLVVVVAITTASKFMKSDEAYLVHLACCVLLWRVLLLL